MGDFGNFKPKAVASHRFFILNSIVSAATGTPASTGIQSVLTSVIIVTVVGSRSRVVVRISRLSAVVGVPRVAADRDQADIARTGVTVRPIAVTTTTVVPPIPRTVIATARRTAATVRIVNADIAVAIATNTLETEGTAIIATGIATARVTAQQIKKTVATVITTTAATTAGETVRITSIAHSISILLVYLRENLIIQYMFSSGFSCI